MIAPTACAAARSDASSTRYSSANRRKVAGSSRRRFSRPLLAVNRRPGDLQIPDQLPDRYALAQMFLTDPCNRLHNQHPPARRGTELGKLSPDRTRGGRPRRAGQSVQNLHKCLVLAPRPRPIRGPGRPATFQKSSICYSARRFDSERGANPLRPRDSRASKFRAE